MSLMNLRSKETLLRKKLTLLISISRSSRLARTLRKRIDIFGQSLTSFASNGRMLTGASKTAGLQLAIDEYKRILPKIEQDRHELQMMKRQLELDNATLIQRWETANEQQARDRETISDLTDKVREVESGQVSTILPSGGLEEELQEHKDRIRAASGLYSVDMEPDAY
jgi:chromosome segregation ATPase